VNRPTISRQNDEPRIVAVSAHDLRELARIVDRLVPRESAGTVVAERLLHAVQDSPTSRAQRMIEDRRRRGQLFGTAMFGEAAWDALLHLYVDHDRRITISRLADLTGGAPTTVIRWLDYLEGRELVRRHRHPRDARAVLLELTEMGVQLLDSYFS
jgi:DNA-binding MarR family transcriptional regulator